MTEREKLIEILKVPIFPHEQADPAEVVADYLLDNGVTIQKWIPAENPPEKEGSYLVCSKTGAEYVPPKPHSSRRKMYESKAFCVVDIGNKKIVVRPDEYEMIGGDGGG